MTIKVSHVTVTTPDDGGPNEVDDIDGAENLIGGDGNDTIEVSNSALGTAPRDTRTLRGNRGADTLRVVNRVRTSMDGGPGRDTVIGGAAEDSIFAREGEADTITCGGALDTLKPDLRDIPISVDCENLDQSDRREGPNVGIRNASVAVGADGLLAVRLACPRSVRIGCKGALSARLESKGTRFGGGERYSLRAGRSVTVEVGLPSGQVARARRRGARVRVRSVERGLHGPKTTLRSLRSRRG